MKNDYSTDPAAASAGSSPPEDTAPRGAGTPQSRIVWFVVALACALLTARFGIWQLSRAHTKLANAALVAERSRMTPLPGSDLARDPASAEGQWQRPITLTGEWVTAHTVFLMNRTMDERSGFYVMTPLRLSDGSAVVVQRGWIPRDDSDPLKVPAIPMPGGPVKVAGHAAPWPSHWIDIGHGAGGPVRQNLELAPFTAESGLALRPLTVVEDATVDNGLDGLRRDWPVPEIGVATNYGYAVQWFAMSIAFLGLYVWLQFIRPRRKASADAHPDSPLAARVDDTLPR